MKHKNTTMEEISHDHVVLEAMSRPSSRDSPPQDKETITENSIPQPGPPPYSQFSRSEKQLIVCLITFAATFSPISSFIFFPAIDAISTSLHVSVEKINLTVTSYLIVTGVALAIIGDLADMTGRRVVYILTIYIYLIANVGLALQNSWVALFILRMLQSTGGAGKQSEMPYLQFLQCQSHADMETIHKLLLLSDTVLFLTLLRQQNGAGILVLCF